MIIIILYHKWSSLFLRSCQKKVWNNVRTCLYSYFDFYQKGIIVSLFCTGPKMFRQLLFISELKEKSPYQKQSWLCGHASISFKGNIVVIFSPCQIMQLDPYLAFAAELMWSWELWIFVSMTANWCGIIKALPVTPTPPSSHIL